jgi:hypothetical protein
VSRGNVTPLGGGYTILFRAEPPEGPRSTGFCSISKRGEVENFRLDAPDPGPPVARNNPAGISAQEAMETCKNKTMERLPTVPRAYISVSRGSNTNEGGYTIHFNADPPRGPRSSGFCIIARGGRVQDFQFNPDQSRPAARVNGGGGGGISPVEAMKTCKDRVAERLPGVALAYINTYRGSDEADGSYMINFNAQPPSGRKPDGFCVVTRNGDIKGFKFDRFDLP